MEHLLDVTFADFPIHRIDPGGVDPDQHLLVHWIWTGRVFVRENFRSTVAIDAHRLHGFHAQAIRVLA